MNDREALIVHLHDHYYIGGDDEGCDLVTDLLPYIEQVKARLVGEIVTAIEDDANRWLNNTDGYALGRKDGYRLAANVVRDFNIKRGLT